MCPNLILLSGSGLRKSPDTGSIIAQRASQNGNSNGARDFRKPVGLLLKTPFTRR